MAKELPYFQFEPAEYLTKDISFCSLSAQGLFTNLCAYYWQRQCKLTRTQFLKRLNYPELFDELLSEGVIDLENDEVKIKFLGEQYCKATKLSKVNSANGSKGGRPKKENPIKTEIKPNKNPIESESKAIREDKIKEEENNNITTIVDNVKIEKQKKFFKPTFEDVREYCLERKNFVDPDKFINYYESNGWKVGKNPMKDWKAAIRTWEKSQIKSNQNGTEKRNTSDERMEHIEQWGKDMASINVNDL
jgi:hypothetical protein